MTKFWHWSDAPSGDFAVVGDPISHSLSPKIHAAAYRSCELELTYRAIHVRSGELAEAIDVLRGRGYRGLNVTVPLKTEALDWCCRVESDVERMGAVNTLNLASGEGTNTDAPGFLKTLGDLGISRGRVLLLGAGGTARALLVALINAGFDVSVWNRTKENADAMVELTRSKAHVLEVPDPSGSDLILNTTAASLKGQSLPILWERASKETLAYDCFYSASKTQFQQDAEEQGIQSVDGRAMLVAQAALAFEWWLGLPAPQTDMMKASYEHPDANA